MLISSKSLSDFTVLVTSYFNYFNRIPVMFNTHLLVFFCLIYFVKNNDEKKKYPRDVHEKNVLLNFISVLYKQTKN